MLAIIAGTVVVIWLLPLAIKAKINRKTILRMILGLLIGGVPVALAAMFFNIFISSKVFGGASLTVELYCLLSSLSVGIVEESVKVLGALLCVWGLKSHRKIDSILIFGAVGAGFEITETFAYSDRIVSSLPRVILALHVVWLLYDGAKYAETKNGKPLALLQAYGWTVVLHALYDCGLMLLQYSDIREIVLAIGFAVTIVGIAANLLFVGRTIKMVNTTIEQE